MRALTGTLLLAAIVVAPAFVAKASDPGSRLQAHAEEGVGSATQDDPALSQPAGGESTPSPILLFLEPCDGSGGGIKCYCGGVFVGCAPTVQGCRNACTAPGAKSNLFFEQAVSR